MTVHSPRLRNSSGAELNLRSQILFQEPTRTHTKDLVTAVASWHKTYVHESSHWARYHGSTVGILLSLLRRSRDQLAAYAISHMSQRQTVDLHEHRSSGVPFLSFKRYPQHAGGELKYNELDWLNLYYTYYVLLDPEGLTEFDATTWDTRAAFENSLEDTWRQSAGVEMAERSEDARVSVTGPLKLVHTSEGPLTTRTLFECAAVIDELFQFEGAFLRTADPTLRELLVEEMSGEYGLPWRLACALAGRDLGGSVVLTLIDFALNPVVPGLTSADPSVDWRELYPPYRFAAAAKAMAGWESDLEFQPLSHEMAVHFQHVLAKRSGLRTGRVVSRPSSLSTLRQAATTPMHLVERTPAVSLMCASRLLDLREEDVCALSHYGANFLEDRAVRFVNPDRGMWWLFPVFQASRGEYRWPAEHVNLNEATDLLLSAAVASAYDDILHGTGPLASDHLPRALIEDRGEAEALNQVLKGSTGLDMGWGRI
ncbi:hypothetical protein ACG5V6_22960 [Streptomyces chitinivorans]|uniref:Uncharacterized protein n=1 Tax=Streptomyces chitinivorans TaxID=1257027 RepID=A0ABW7HYR9_9ACTN|nr:hypothetical protein [Streptomyces chitinivorans]MDH2411927.1 hypothetical protein [Streptomyces chitinivorans]